MQTARTRAIDMVSPQIEVIDASKDILGESAIWDAKAQLLWWVDGMGQKIHRLDPSTNKKTSWPFEEEVGSIGLRAKGGLIVGMRSGLYTFDAASGKLTVLVQPETDRPGNRFNDGKVCRAGRFFTGTVQAAPYTPRGRMWRLDADLSVHQFMDGVTCNNGLSFSPDNRLMYFSDSFSYRIDVFDYDDTSGNVHNRRLFTEIPVGRGICDGSTVDADGCFWSANIDGWCVTRHDPRGRVDMVINLLVRRPTSLAFGGKDLDILYITTATRRMPERELAQQPLSGCLLAVRPGVKGLPEPEFAG